MTRFWLCCISTVIIAVLFGKGFDWDAMNRIHEKGLIFDPIRKAKSVGFSEEEKQARGIFEQIFVVNKNMSADSHL